MAHRIPPFVQDIRKNALLYCTLHVIVVNIVEKERARVCCAQLSLMLCSNQMQTIAFLFIYLRKFLKLHLVQQS